MYAWEEDQTNYTMRDYNALYQELRKIVDIAIEYHVNHPPGENITAEVHPIWSAETQRRNDAIMRSLDLSRMTHETLALFKVTMYPDELEKMVQVFPNLAPLRDMKPLEKPLYLRKTPFNLYDFARDMNIYE